MTGNIRAYFDHFYEAIAAEKDAIPQDSRRRYVVSYSEPDSLTQGFGFYRAFEQDAADNTRDQTPIRTPVLYIRGSRESGTLADYRNGLAGAGVQSLTTSVIEGAGHFTPEEAPQSVWAAIAAHVSSLAATSD